ncbi:MAG: hypothetical protein MHPSP_001235, partial [Paramarteilia canceri]
MSEIEINQKKIEDINCEINQHLTEKDNLEENICAYNKKLDHSKSKGSINSIKKHLEEARNQEKVMKSEFQKEIEALESFKTAIAMQENDLEIAKNKLATITNNLKEIKLKIEAKKNEINQLTQDLTEIEEKVANKRSYSSSLMKERQKLEADIKNLKNDALESKNRLSELYVQKSKYESDIKILSKEVSKIKSENSWIENPASENLLSQYYSESTK